MAPTMVVGYYVYTLTLMSFLTSLNLAPNSHGQLEAVQCRQQEQSKDMVCMLCCSHFATSTPKIIFDVGFQSGEHCNTA